MKMKPQIISLDLKRFFKNESSAGIILFAFAFFAIIVANSPFYNYYQMLLDIPVSIKIGDLKIDKGLLLWVNDGLMALFFLLVGLELKREFLEGELSSPRKIILPALGAIGGMAVPAIIYVALNYEDPVAVHGWAIPAATDIAFALGVLALLGSRVPVSLKILLTSIAIFDDIGAIVIIALFYTSKISFTALGVAAISMVFLFMLNRRGVGEKSLYIIIGVIMWVAMLKSGIHATLAGVVLAMFIPMTWKRKPEVSPLKSMEHDLHHAVAFFILPVFAFFNAGINLSGVGVEQIMHPVPLGIMLGLFFGKQIGVFGFCWLGVKMKMAELPQGASWLSLYGLAVLCGIGFTMSLFIGSLAFHGAGDNVAFDERLGIVGGSLIAGIWGFSVLFFSGKKSTQDAVENQNAA